MSNNVGWYSLRNKPKYPTTSIIQRPYWHGLVGNASTKLEFYNKFLECFDDEGMFKPVKGVLKKVSIRQVTTL